MSGFPTIAVDIQHLYRTGIFAGDRGTRFRMADGRTLYEADAVTTYAQALAAWLRAWGAQVVVNDPARGILVGPYSRRNAQAATLEGRVTAEGVVLGHVDAYLACHLNAGLGDYALCEYMATLPAATGTVCQALADWILHGGINDPEVRGRSVKRLVRGERGAVCIQAVAPTVPALILEPFFGDQPRHLPLLETARLVRLGQEIGQGVAAWWRATHAPT